MSVTHPELALEFHPTKNGDLIPTKITAGTGKKLWWVCKKCEHEWQAPGTRRKNRGSGCPACSNHTVHIDGRNSMRSIFPLLAAEFHPKNNGDLTPEKLLPGTNKRLWWKCSKCENEWIASGNDRRNGNGCPTCSGRSVHSDGRNSMAMTHPDLVKELHPTKNQGLDFNQIRPGTDKKIWWKCRKCEHDWIAHGYQRTGPMSSGCPACANQVLHSDGRNSLKSRFPKLSEEWNQDNDSLPEEVLAGSGKKAKWKCRTCDHDWSVRIVNRTGVKKSGCPACKNLEIHRDGRNSMAITHPHLVKELHPTKNQDLAPHEIIAGTGKKLWWLCSVCQHEWSAGGNSRSQGRGCPACSGKTVHSDGRNSMAVTHPELAAELHPTLNGELTASEVVAGTQKKLWWLCSVCENEWAALRNSGKHGCPSCSRRAIHSDGRNSMAITHPHLVKELHPTKNKDLSPRDIIAGTGKKLWWLCSVCQHEWKTGGNMRAKKNGTGCPSCSNQKIHVDGRNSLAAANSEIASEFHPTKNGEITSEEVGSGSHKRVWWLCKTCEHEWRTTPGHRTQRGSGCPACSNKVLHIHGLNSLAVTHPDLAAEFHPEKNEGLTPSDIIAGTHRRLWWLCSTCDHDWISPGKSRVLGIGCPACDNKVIHRDGRNSMASTHPELAKEFHPTKNGDTTPSDLVAGTSKKLWWLCSKCGNEWPASSSPRTKGVGCPACAPSGFDQTKSALLYVLFYDCPIDQWYKVGVTNNDISERLGNLSLAVRKTKMYYDAKISVVETLEFEVGGDAYELEQKLLEIEAMKFFPAEKFDGSREFLTSNPLDYARENGWV
jgi:Zn finger protein HypA/HybF involved in hydrogenase expression